MKTLKLLCLTCFLIVGCKEGEQGPVGPEVEQGPAALSTEDSLAVYYETFLEAARPISIFQIYYSPLGPYGYDIFYSSNSTWSTDDGILVFSTTFSDGTLQSAYPLSLIKALQIYTDTGGTKTATLYY